MNDLLSNALKYPVALVIAGTGYGKTHAVYSYLQKRQFLTVWIQLTERDNIGERFWENFTRSISMINKESAAKMAEQGFPATGRQFERYLAIPLSDINRNFKYVIVYDDIHLIHDKTVLRFLERSITTPFLNITSILISRQTLNLNLMKLYSKGHLTVIKQDDLKFKKDEMERFFEMMEVQRPDEMLDKVYEDTEGWAFAIHLAALYFIRIPSGEDFGAWIRRNVYHLMESEIMERISARVRKCLIKLALLTGTPSPELVRGLTGIHFKTGLPEDADELLRQVEGICTFVRFDEYQNVFSVHRMFRDYLLSLQNELTENERNEVYHYAASWCARNNRRMEAIAYYEKAGAYGELIGQIQLLPIELPRKTVDQLMAVIERFPRRVYLEYADACVVLARFLLNEGQLAETRKKLLDNIKYCEKMEESGEKYRLLCGYWLVLGFVCEMLAVFNHDYSFPEYFEKGACFQKKWGEKIGGPLAVTVLGDYICRVGAAESDYMKRFLAALAESVPFVSAALSGNMYGLEEAARGELALFRMDLKEAERLIRAAIEKARERGQYEIETRCWFYLVRIGLFHGSAALVIEGRNGVRGLFDREDYANRYAFNDLFRGWFFAQLGECWKVPSWIKAEDGKTPYNSLVRGFELLVKARTLFREKNCEAALTVLKETWSNAYAFIIGKVEVKVLEAACLYQLKRKSAACAALEEARKFAEPNGLYAPFAELGKDMRSLSAQLLKDNDSGLPKIFLEKIRALSAAYAKRQFQVYEELAGKLELSQASSELSRREYEVLNALFKGQTQEEIAQGFARSANTIKSVIKRIYEKLGALNKADAIRIALSKKILFWNDSADAKPAAAGGMKRRLLLRKDLEPGC